MVTMGKICHFLGKNITLGIDYNLTLASVQYVKSIKKILAGVRPPPFLAMTRFWERLLRQYVPGCYFNFDFDWQPGQVNTYNSKLLDLDAHIRVELLPIPTKTDIWKSKLSNLAAHVRVELLVPRREQGGGDVQPLSIQAQL